MNKALISTSFLPQIENRPTKKNKQINKKKKKKKRHKRKTKKTKQTIKPLDSNLAKVLVYAG